MKDASVLENDEESSGNFAPSEANANDAHNPTIQAWRKKIAIGCVFGRSNQSPRETDGEI
jgi:hypothetical protein